MRISDWSSTCALPISLHLDSRDRDVEAEIERLPREIVAGGEAMDHAGEALPVHLLAEQCQRVGFGIARVDDDRQAGPLRRVDVAAETVLLPHAVALVVIIIEPGLDDRSEEHTSELQSLMRRSYAVF